MILNGLILLVILNGLNDIKHVLMGYYCLLMDLSRSFI